MWENCARLPCFSLRPIKPDRRLAQLERPPPAGVASWDGGALALALDVSDDAVWRVLRKQGIQVKMYVMKHVRTDLLTCHSSV